MKKLFLILSVFFCTGLSAQNIVNGDFVINNGNDIPNSGCPTFSNGSVLNWIGTHGTPSFVSADEIYLFAQNWGGEGITGRYRFRRGVTYCIAVKISMWNTPSGDLKLYACNGLVPFQTGACGDAIPSFPSSIENIFTGTMSVGWNMVTYIPNNDYGELWVFPDFYGPDGQQFSVVIDEIQIIPPCPDITHNDGQVAPDVYKGNRIYAGTSFGGSNIVTTYTPNSFVEYRAADFVLIQDDFLAISEAHGEAYFLALIEPCEGECDTKLIEEKRSRPQIEARRVNTPDIQERQQTSLSNLIVYSNPNLDSNNRVKPGLFEIFPNPVVDQLKIHFTCQESNMLYVVLKDISGIERKREQVYCNESGQISHIIDVKDLQTGVYYIELTIGHTHHVRKVIKM